eukprot:61601-Heterocapsa_arctica.AAC.1
MWNARVCQRAEGAGGVGRGPGGPILCTKPSGTPGPPEEAASSLSVEGRAVDRPWRAWLAGAAP